MSGKNCTVKLYIHGFEPFCITKIYTSRERNYCGCSLRTHGTKCYEKKTQNGSTLFGYVGSTHLYYLDMSDTTITTTTTTTTITINTFPLSYCFVLEHVIHGLQERFS